MKFLVPNKNAKDDIWRHFIWERNIVQTKNKKNFLLKKTTTWVVDFILTTKQREIQRYHTNWQRPNCFTIFFMFEWHIDTSQMGGETGLSLLITRTRGIGVRYLTIVFDVFLWLVQNWYSNAIYEEKNAGAYHLFGGGSDTQNTSNISIIIFGQTLYSSTITLKYNYQTSRFFTIWQLSARIRSVT